MQVETRPLRWFIEARSEAVQRDVSEEAERVRKTASKKHRAQEEGLALQLREKRAAKKANLLRKESLSSLSLVYKALSNTLRLSKGHEDLRGFHEGILKTVEQIRALEKKASKIPDREATPYVEEQENVPEILRVE